MACKVPCCQCRECKQHPFLKFKVVLARDHGVFLQEFSILYFYFPWILPKESCFQDPLPSIPPLLFLLLASYFPYLTLAERSSLLHLLQWLAANFTVCLRSVQQLKAIDELCCSYGKLNIMYILAMWDFQGIQQLTLISEVRKGRRGFLY